MKRCFVKPHRGIERRSSWMGQRKLYYWKSQRLEVMVQMFLSCAGAHPGGTLRT